MFQLDTKGIKINDSNFWLDAHRKVSFSFVSHGHADHIRNHDIVLATPATARFFSMRAKRKKVIELDYEKDYRIDDMKIRLYPAGHILGSAMIHIEKDGKTLLYTGDFKMTTGFTSEPIKIPSADVLIMESTFGSPDYVIDSNPETIAGELNLFINDCFRNGLTPVVLAYGLGKAQEAMKLLGDQNYRIRVHKYAWQFVQVYRDYNVQFKNCTLWREQTVPRGEVLILPPHLTWRKKYRFIPGTRSVFLSGWAKKGAGPQFKCNHAIAMSDHSDFFELVDFVKQVNPQRVYTTHGFKSFPEHLKSFGFNAQLLESTNQLELF
ncbi:hypothetical protein JW935_25180 [candidate division KSB1 bacterium]|nr:hypothetical protein [candidate division KSB1 bacterium]